MQNYAELNRIQYFADILILSGLVLLSATVFGLIGVFSASTIYHLEYKEAINLLSEPSTAENAGFFKVYNAISTFGAWVVSGFLFSKIRSFNINIIWQFKWPRIKFIWLLLPIILISALYISAYLLNINQRLPLPESVRTLFDSVNSKGLLENMLRMNGFSDLVLNIFYIALLPAVFEEIFFRGTLQPLFIGFFKNHHLGIWFCSFIFALIHLNVLQFIPMMFLALVLGYLFYYSRSIYPGILIHLANNSFAVVAYYYQEKSELAKKIVEDNYVPGMLSFIIFALVLTTVFYFIIQQDKLTSKHE